MLYNLKNVNEKFERMYLLILTSIPTFIISFIIFSIVIVII